MTSKIQVEPEDTLANDLLNCDYSGKVVVGLVTGKEITGTLAGVGADYLWFEHSTLPCGGGWISLSAVAYVAFAEDEDVSP